MSFCRVRIPLSYLCSELNLENCAPSVIYLYGAVSRYLCTFHMCEIRVLDTWY